MCSEQFYEDCAKKFEFFFHKTSLHGFSYIVNRTLFYYDRILWTIIIGVQIYFCYFYAELYLHRRNTYPILLAYDTKSTFVSEVRFIVKSIKCTLKKTNDSSKLNTKKNKKLNDICLFVCINILDNFFIVFFFLFLFFFYKFSI